MLTLNQTKTNTGEDDGWSAKWWSKRKGSLTDDRRSDGWSVMTEWGEREVRWSVRGRERVMVCVAETVSVWQKQWVRESLLVKFEKYPIWNRVCETRFPDLKPSLTYSVSTFSTRGSRWKPRQNRVLNTRFSRGVHLDLLPRQG